MRRSLTPTTPIPDSASPAGRAVVAWPTPSEQAELFRLKHGDPATAGPGPRRRWKFGYFTPDDQYETLVHSLVTPGCRWLDVGSGRDLFPSNRRLAERLSARAGWLVGVDPSANIQDNRFVHERFQGFIEDYASDQPFDLVTSRMVAEHITDPPAMLRTLARLVRPGGLVVIYTVNRWTPIALVSALVPFGLHNPIKKFFWGTEERDTFPVAYRMNTRRDLVRLFAAAGFDEVLFRKLDDCRAMANFRWPHYAELATWRMLHTVRLSYPENCLLGVYRRRGSDVGNTLTSGPTPI